MGVAFLDSMPLAVYDNHRMATPRGCTSLAVHGQTAMGWCYSFTWPAIGNDSGVRRAWRLTPGHVDDRQPVVRRAAGLGGPLLGDRGYMSQALHAVRVGPGLARLTTSRKHMKHRVLRWWAKWLLRQRSLIETLHEQVKNLCQIEHTRHRRVPGFRIKLGAGLVVSSSRPKNPRLVSDVIPWGRCSSCS